MTRTLSLLTPSGRLTLGSYLGALLPMSRRQEDAFYGVSDLHAMTTEHDPRLLRLVRRRDGRAVPRGRPRSGPRCSGRATCRRTRSCAYLLECVATTGELNRMIQFKEKGRGVDSIRAVSLFTYPALMAADILLYRPRAGAGRRRPAPARRADPRPGAAVRPPLRPGLRRHEVVTASDGTARVMDLLHPDRKMFEVRGRGRLGLPARPARRRTPQIARAVTDFDTGPAAVRRSPRSPASPTCWTSWRRAAARPPASTPTVRSTPRSPTPSWPPWSRSRSGTPTFTADPCA